MFEDVGLWQRARYFPRAGETLHEAVLRECRAVRDDVGMFDASTLGKIEVAGPDAADFLDRIYVNALANLAAGRCRYGLLLREDGFVFDDGIVARLAADRFHVTTTTGGAARVLHMMEDYRRPMAGSEGLAHRRPPSNGRSSPCKARARANARAAGRGHRHARPCRT